MLVRRKHRNDREDPLEVGAVAVVYGMRFYRDGTAPYLFLGVSWPYERTSADYDVVVPELSRHFCVGIDPGGMRGGITRIGYPEFAECESHWADLVEGMDDAVARFRMWRDVLDVEFPAPHLASGCVLDESWVQCPTCLDAVQCTPAPGVVVCDACATAFNNPLYVPTPQFRRDRTS